MIKDKFGKPIYGWAYIQDVNWVTYLHIWGAYIWGPRIPRSLHFFLYIANSFSLKQKQTNTIEKNQILLLQENSLLFLQTITSSFA